jgi:hypothetical protein
MSLLSTNMQYSYIPSSMPNTPREPEQLRLNVHVYGETFRDMKRQAFREAEDFFGYGYEFKIKDEDKLYIGESYGNKKGKYSCTMYVIAEKILQVG